MKRLLAIDIGNTHSTLAVFEGAALRHTWRISSNRNRTTDELWVLVEACLHAVELSDKDLRSIGISSVVPPLTRSFAKLCRERIGIEPIVIQPAEFKQMKILYEPVTAVGPDRLCSVVAGMNKFGAPLIVIDLGTATVFDVVNGNGEYAGGVIAPGLNTAAESLHSMTAALPRVELEFPKSVVGASTIASIQSGILFGAIDMIDGIVRRIQQTLASPAKVIATGGLADILASRSTTIEAVEPTLVLDGIRQIVEAT